MHFDLAIADRYSKEKKIEYIVYEVRPESLELRQKLYKGRPIEKLSHGEPKPAYTSGLPISLQIDRIFQEGYSLSLSAWKIFKLVTERMSWAAYLFLPFTTETAEFMMLYN